MKDDANVTEPPYLNIFKIRRIDLKLTSSSLWALLSLSLSSLSVVLVWLKSGTKSLSTELNEARILADSGASACCHGFHLSSGAVQKAALSRGWGAPAFILPLWSASLDRTAVFITEFVTAVGDRRWFLAGERWDGRYRMSPQVTPSVFL